MAYALDWRSYRSEERARNFAREKNATARKYKWVVRKTQGGLWVAYRTTDGTLNRCSVCGGVTGTFARTGVGTKNDYTRHAFSSTCAEVRAGKRV